MFDNTKQANFTTKPRFENGNVDKFRKQQKRKWDPRDKNTKVPEGWENF